MCQLKMERKYKAVRDTSDWMPCWGNGSDLAIHENCNKNNYSYSCLGDTYEDPKEPGVNKEYFLAGSYEFTVKEMEIYQVINKK